MFHSEQIENTLPRTRIDALYEEAQASDIISAVAEAGYGKTQSVISFLADSDKNVIWVPFSQLDNYPAYFWENFCNAINGISPEMSRIMLKSGFPAEPAMMHHFVERFLAIPWEGRPIVFVFDDCHIITEPAIFNFVLSLTTLRTQHITTFLVSRPNTILNSPQMLLGRRAVFIDEKTLAFTYQELEEYYRMLDLPVHTNVLHTVYEKTAGWPIAVWLSTIYTREHQNEIFLPSFFSWSLLDDVIEREIFQAYTPQEQQFLLKLSLLDFIPVRYMEEIYGQTGNSYAAMNPLIRYNEHSNSYHLHQMFQEFLRKRTGQLGEETIRKTYLQAAEWFLKYDLKIDALYCYRQINDREGLWNIIWETILSTRDPGQELIRYILEIVEQYFIASGSENPWIPWIQANFHSCMAEFDLAAQGFRQIIEAAPEPENAGPDGVIVGEAYIILALLSMLYGDISFYDYFVRAKEYLPQGSVRFKKGHMILLNGDIITLREGNPGELKLWVSTIRKTAAVANDLLHGITYGIDDLAMAQAFYYQGNVLQAERYALLALENSKAKQCIDLVGNAYYLLQKVAMFQGDYEKARQYVETSLAYMKEYNDNPSYNLPEIAESYLYLQLGQYSLIKPWILENSSYDDNLMPSNYGLERIIKAYYLLVKKKYSELMAYLDHSVKIYTNGNRFIALIYVHLFYAVAHHQLGDDEKALAEFEIVYQMAAPNQLVMPIAEIGHFSRAIALTVGMKSTVIPEEWLRKVQAKASTYRKRMQALQQEFYLYNDKGEQTKKLSLRERELLIYIGQGLTQTEIAEEMQISINTAKSITKNIYAKLGALNSSQAIYLAMKNGLLE